MVPKQKTCNVDAFLLRYRFKPEQQSMSQACLALTHRFTYNNNRWPYCSGNADYNIQKMWGGGNEQN